MKKQVYVLQKRNGEHRTFTKIRDAAIWVSDDIAKTAILEHSKLYANIILKKWSQTAGRKLTVEETLFKSAPKSQSEICWIRDNGY